MNLDSRTILPILIGLGAALLLSWTVISFQKQDSFLTKNPEVKNEQKTLKTTSDIRALAESTLSVRTGSESPRVVVVEFLDFQCPFCRRSVETMHALLRAYADQPVQFQFRHLPIFSIHPFALDAARASLCAHEQGAFMSMHDRLYERQDEISQILFRRVAQELALDIRRFEQCMTSGKFDPILQKDLSDAAALNIPGTPTWYINGEPLFGALPFERLDAIIKSKLAQ